MVWLTDERHLALFPAATIVRDPQPSQISDTPRNLVAKRNRVLFGDKSDIFIFLVLHFFEILRLYLFFSKTEKYLHN